MHIPCSFKRKTTYETIENSATQNVSYLTKKKKKIARKGTNTQLQHVDLTHIAPKECDMNFVDISMPLRINPMLVPMQNRINT